MADALIQRVLSLVALRDLGTQIRPHSLQGYEGRKYYPLWRQMSEMSLWRTRLVSPLSMSKCKHARGWDFSSALRCCLSASWGNASYGGEEISPALSPGDCSREGGVTRSPKRNSAVRDHTSDLPWCFPWRKRKMMLRAPTARSPAQDGFHVGTSPHVT